MKYIELKPGLKVNRDEVIIVEDIDEMTCKVETSIGTFKSIYPSWRILKQLEQSDINEKTPIDRVNLWGKQHYAG